MNGILVCEGKSPNKNIGDYIQSIAGAQFFDATDCYVEREQLNSFNPSNQINVIMNGWYMWAPENFPPVSDNLNPLLLSMHIWPKISERMLTPDAVEYLKKHEPIGARDMQTMRTLRSHGIDSYFSGCLTLTLGNTYKRSEVDDSIYIVDPYYELPKTGGLHNFYNLISGAVKIARYYHKIRRIANRYTDQTLVRESNGGGLKKWMRAAFFYHAYHKVFTDDILLNAKFISHDVKVKDYDTNVKMMDYADTLLRKYSKAKLVITSRIHCALPCLALETPVIFVDSKTLDSDSYRPSGRLEGLIELFRVLNFSNGKWTSNDDFLSGVIKRNKISSTIDLQNPSSYKAIRDNLNKTVRNWINKGYSI